MAKEPDAATQAAGTPQAEAKAPAAVPPPADGAAPPPPAAGGGTATSAAPPSDGPKKKKKPGVPPRKGKKLRNQSKNADQKVRAMAAQPLRAAVAELKKLKRAKFDETVEIHMNLGIDAAQSDQMVRGGVALPHGIGKNVRVVVSARG